MLATPLSGRFVGENRKLVFAPPQWYFWLIYATGIASLLFFAHGTGVLQSGLFLLNNPPVCLMTGSLLAIAALFAFVSLERITIDLKERTYRRWFGRSFLPGYASGKLSELESMVVLAEDKPFSPSFPGRTAMYRLTLVWKGMTLPVMVVEEHAVPLAPHVPLPSGNAFAMQRAYSFCSAMQVPLIDHTAVSSGHPTPIL